MFDTILAGPGWHARDVAAEVIDPPPPIDFEKWAEGNISFSKRESQFPGPYNKDLFPLFSEILKALGPDDPCREVTFKKSAQLGGTVLGNIFVLGSQAMDPGDILFVHPTEENARRWSKLKLKPMLRSTSCLSRVFPEKSRDTSDTVLFKERTDGRGSILISGANSPASLSQVSMPRLVLDDLSKWEINSAGDPEAQAESRAEGYEFAKIFKASTPLINPGCRISKNYMDGSQEEAHVPCPHEECGHMHVLEWENMLAQLDEDDPDDAHFTCPECGGEIREHQLPAIIRKGKWVAKNPKAKRYHRSFYLWSAYSLLQSWARIARKWFKAKGDPAAEQTFLNDVVGQAYETKGEAPPWETLRERAEQFGHKLGTIPAGGLLVCMGIDCQGDRVEWLVRAYGRDGRSWVVDFGKIDTETIAPYLPKTEAAHATVAHISEPATRKALDKLLLRKWPNAAGRRLGLDMVAIDGNAYTEDVWGWARRHPASRLIMVRGSNSEAAPLFAKVKKERKNGRLLKYSSRFFNFNAAVLKMALYRNLKKTDPALAGFVGLPAGCPDEFFQQATAERRAAKRGRDGYVKYSWQLVHDRNEVLDMLNQAEAAAIKLGVRTMPEELWDRLEAERDIPPKDPQLDFEDLPPVNAVVQSEVPKRVRKVKQMRRG